VIGQRIGRFVIEAPLGEGGFATVWRARDTLLGRDVALKLMHEGLLDSSKARQRFLHEGRAAAALGHPGIAAIYDVGEDGGRLYIAMQRVEGETVSALVSPSPLAIEDAVRIAAAAADALGHAHERGVVHRDVTGRNVMVARDGRVVVLDFGLALVTGQTRLTSAAHVLGTMHYLAPEVMRGDEADARTDLFGLGVVLYHALTGTFPHALDEASAIVYATMNMAPVSPRTHRPEVSEALERVVLRAIALEPSARFQTAAELAAALRALEAGSTPTAAAK